MLHASLLGTIAFTLNDAPVTLPTGRALELLVYLASSPLTRTMPELEALFGDASQSALSSGLEAFLPFLEFYSDGMRFAGSSDVNAYRVSEGDLKALAKKRGEFAAGLTVTNPAFQAWLEAERFSLRRVFLSALLQNGAGLEESGRVAEGQKNLEFVERERAGLPANFAAELSLEIAKHHWRLNRPALAAETLEAALPDLSGASTLEAQVNLGAALVRLGRIADSLRTLEMLPDTHGWGLLHRANARRFTDDLGRAVAEADIAYRLAAGDEDGYLAVAALSVKGEALLELAMQAGTEPKDAVIAFGKAFGISEILGEEASAGTLAGLAHAHAVWGNQQKALEQAEKAFKRARAAKDGTATVRALLSLYAVTHIGSFARNALTEAQSLPHKPLELLASLCVLEKDSSQALLNSTLELARLIGCHRLSLRAEAFAASGKLPL